MSRLHTASESIDDIAVRWFTRQAAADFTAQEATELEAWLDDDPAHRAAFDAVGFTWQGIEPLRADPRVRALMNGRPRRWVRQAIAACLAVAVLGGGGFAGWYYWPQPTLSTQQFSTGVGEKATVTLPDGSVVTLSTDTLVRTEKDDGKRLVYLDRGQAFFKVAKDSAHPFEVHAAGRTVTALGTAFDVRVDRGRFEVTLVEGKVRVAAPVKPAAAPETPGAAPAVRTTEMLAGDQFVATTDREWSVARTDPTRETSWLVGRLKFEGEPLGDVVGEFNRYSQRKVVIDDPALAARPVSGAFRADDQDAFIAALEIAHLAVVQSETDEVVRLGRP